MGWPRRGAASAECAVGGVGEVTLAEDEVADDDDVVHPVRFEDDSNALGGFSAKLSSPTPRDATNSSVGTCPVRRSGRSENHMVVGETPRVSEVQSEIRRIIKRPALAGLAQPTSP